jgi:hypothetical protein
MDHNEVELLLKLVERANPNLYPKLKPIHDAAMKRLEEIAADAAKEAMEELRRKGRKS